MVHFVQLVNNQITITVVYDGERFNFFFVQKHRHYILVNYNIYLTTYDNKIFQFV